MPSQEDIEAQQELLAAHHLTLTIFSGLPGTGKTTLARLVAAHLHLPLVPLDDIVDIIPPHMGAHAQPFWQDYDAHRLGRCQDTLDPQSQRHH
jgi:AAA+ superfamily predicted ATPase